MPKDKIDIKPKTAIQLIWLSARCNGADYHEPPRYGREWPRETWLEQRREYIRQKNKKVDSR